MLFCKRITNDYKDLKCIYSVIDFIYRNNGNNNTYVGGINIANPIKAADEFMLVKRYYGKTEGTQLRHYVISPDPKELFIPYMATELGYQICAYYADKFQSVFSVHTNTSHLHIHVVINTVSYVNGKKLHEGIGDLITFENYCRACYEIIKNKYRYIDKNLKAF